MRCSRHFSATSASVNFEPTTGMSARSLSRNGIAPMWSSCACVSTSASTSSRRSSTWRRSGRIRSTPGCIVRREQHTAVDDQQSTKMLENGHVPADFADPAQRGNAQAARTSGPGGASSSFTTAAPWLPACRRPTPRSDPASPAPEAAADHHLNALQAQSLLSQRHATEPGLRVTERPECDVDLARRRHIAGVEGGQHVSQLTGGHVSPYADEARPRPSPATAG